MKAYYICTKCGKMEEVTTRASKCECGGLWKLQYELPKYDEALIDKGECSAGHPRPLCRCVQGEGNGGR